MNNKKGYIDFIIKQLKNLLVELEQEINSIDAEIGNETKSSAGDKFETSREMMSQARKRLEERANALGNQIRNLKSIEVNKNSSKVDHGSLIKTDKGCFFFGISLEKLEFQGNTIFNLSLASPLGQHFVAKGINDQVSFRNSVYTILEIK